jgi:hypothetical protein
MEVLEGGDDRLARPVAGVVLMAAEAGQAEGRTLDGPSEPLVGPPQSAQTPR